MKEIQGKIKLGVIPSWSFRADHKYGVAFRGQILEYYTDEPMDIFKEIIPLWKITPEQCAELIGGYDLKLQDHIIASKRNDDLKRSVKESLISLLKVNNCWTKEMVRNHKFTLSKENTSQEDDVIYKNGQKIRINDLPDDFLIIKL